MVDIPPLSFIDDIIGISECGQKAIEMNSFINSKIEMKRLIFSDSKCYQIHVGKENSFCPELQVHGEKMEKISSEKYLGDILSSENKNEENISRKISKGMGIMTQIMNLLTKITYGSFQSFM